MKDTLKGCNIEVKVQTVDWQSTFGPEEAVYAAIEKQIESILQEK